MMEVQVRNDVDEALDDLLSRWHDWQIRGRLTRGFNDRALVVGNFKGDESHDEENGVTDQCFEDARSRAINYEVREMQQPWQAAIYNLARNLYSGWDVWHSPQLPESKAERDVIVAQAREQLMRRLPSAWWESL